MFTRFIKYIRYSAKEIFYYFDLSKYRFFRCLAGGVWYKHESTGQLHGLYDSFWARYGTINRFTSVVEIEHYL